MNSIFLCGTQLVSTEYTIYNIKNLSPYCSEVLTVIISHIDYNLV